MAPTPNTRISRGWSVVDPVSFLLLGCFAPSRYQFQHFYVFVPLALAAIVSALYNLTQLKLYQLLALISSFTFAVVSGFKSVEEYSPIRNVTKPSEWFPERARLTAAEIRAHAPVGRILTLAPAYPLEDRLLIYPQFATGAFAWRSASLIPMERRRQLHIVAPEDLGGLLAAEPPAGILTGVEDDEEEAPLITWAKANGYVRLLLKRKRSLWIPAVRE